MVPALWYNKYIWIRCGSAAGAGGFGQHLAQHTKQAKPYSNPDNSQFYDNYLSKKSVGSKSRGTRGLYEHLDHTLVLKKNTHCYRYLSKLWAMHALSTNANVCCVCHVCCPKLVMNKNWWCSAYQMLMSSLMTWAVYHSYIHPLAPE